MAPGDVDALLRDAQRSLGEADVSRALKTLERARSSATKRRDVDELRSVLAVSQEASERATGRRDVGAAERLLYALKQNITFHERSTETGAGEVWPPPSAALDLVPGAVEGSLDLSADGKPMLLATTPEEALRMAQLKERRKELISALSSAGFTFKFGRPWGEDDVLAYNSALHFVIRQGLSIEQAVERVASRDFVQLSIREEPQAVVSVSSPPARSGGCGRDSPFSAIFLPQLRRGSIRGRELLSVMRRCGTAHTRNSDLARCDSSSRASEDSVAASGHIDLQPRLRHLLPQWPVAAVSRARLRPCPARRAAAGALRDRRARGAGVRRRRRGPALSPRHQPAPRDGRRAALGVAALRRADVAAPRPLGLERLRDALGASGSGALAP